MDLTARSGGPGRAWMKPPRACATHRQRLDEIGHTVAEQLKGSMVAVNSLARNIAAVNEQIARAKGNGQPANDLLDQRDQLIRELNQHIQTSQVAADDGSVSVFCVGDSPLVLGNVSRAVHRRPRRFWCGQRQEGAGHSSNLVRPPR